MPEKNRKNPWKALLMSGVVSLLVAGYFFYSAKTLERTIEESEIELLSAMEASIATTNTAAQLPKLEGEQKNAKHISMVCFGLGIVLVGLGIRLQRFDLSRG